VRLVVPTVVQLDHWFSPAFGDRWTLTHEDRALITRATAFEARQVAKEMGWQVEGVSSEDVNASPGAPPAPPVQEGDQSTR
jgi:hypothetical protein